MIHQRNTGRADRVIAFLNKLPLVDGEAIGQRFVVDPWAEAWIRDIYEPEYEDGRRVVREAALSVARKNAKSYLVAGLKLCHLIGPEAVPNGQIYSAAVDREQASVIFHMCRKMIEAEPALAKRLTVISSTKTIMVKAGITTRGSGSVYRALSAEVSAKHGLGASFFVYDEFGEARNGELWDVLLDSQQAQASPLAVAISTQNNDHNHPFSQMLTRGLKKTDPAIVVHVHAADEGCDLMDREQWLKANPALLTWKRPDAIEAAARKAIDLPATEPNFRRRYLNQQVSAHNVFISSTDWHRCLPHGAPLEPSMVEADSEQFEAGEEIYAGLDMSLRTDLTALVCYSPTSGLVKTYPFKPQSLLQDHGRRDQQTYDLWCKQGWMNATSGRSIGAEFVAAKIAEIHKRNPIKGLAYDRAYTEELLKQLDAQGLLAQEGEGSGLRIVNWGQGFISMGKAVNAFEHLVLQNQLRSDGNPTLTMAVLNAVTDMDPAGNRKFMKNKSTMRIDPAVALAMAVGLAAEDRSKTSTKTIISAFEDEDFDLELY